MCDDRLISGIIKERGIQPGQPMFSRGGVEIPDSVVVNAYTALYLHSGSYTIHSEDPLTGEERIQNFTPEAMAVIRNIDF
jgi:hypothetical protein